MIWSFSGHASYRRCPRQWFYSKVLANSLAKDPLRREAYRLSKLNGIHAWRGRIVDTVLSETIIPSIIWNRPCSIDVAKRRAEDLFMHQRPQRLGGNGEGASFETEYGLPLSDEMFSNARSEISTALENFYAAETVWTLFGQAKALIPQRPLSFKQGSVSVRVVPDLIAFRHPHAPVVLDWKVNARPLRDYWLQLVVGAIALTQCNSHRDWPSGATQHAAHDITLLEVQLLSGDVRPHTISETDIQEAEDLISISASDMELARGGGDAKTLKPEDFPVASDPQTCQWCSFRKLCWEAGG